MQTWNCLLGARTCFVSTFLEKHLLLDFQRARPKAFKWFVVWLQFGCILLFIYISSPRVVRHYTWTALVLYIRITKSENYIIQSNIKYDIGHELVTVNRLQVLNHSFERMKKNCINVYIYLESTKELILLILLYLCGFLIHVYNVWKKEPCLMHKTWLLFPYIVHMY